MEKVRFKSVSNMPKANKLVHQKLYWLCFLSSQYQSYGVPDYGVHPPPGNQTCKNGTVCLNIQRHAIKY